MRRVGGLMPRVVSFENLLLAFRRASRGKKDRPAVARFERDLEPELLVLSRELSSGGYLPGRPAVFTIRDPKERLISCPPFRDRVVHHAIVNVLESVLEARFDADSYGCRKGKGLDAALARAQDLGGRHPFVLKTDVEKFYDSVDLAVLGSLLRRILKDGRLLALLDVVLGGGKRGLPIGSLTSQWLANLYLTPLDRHLRAEPAAQGQVRYMDDVLVFGDGREALRQVRHRMREFLRVELRLSLKRDATVIHRSGEGVPYLGFRVDPDTIEVRRESFRRFRAGVERAEWEYRTGRLTVRGLAASVESRTAHVARGRSLGLRKAFFADRRAVEW